MASSAQSCVRAPGKPVDGWLNDRSLAGGWARLQAGLDKATQRLLAERNTAGCWEGELSSSALSTATAVIALALVQGAKKSAAPAADQAVQAGLRWLARQANADGGWGDTCQSFSNISTTALGWAAFGVVPDAEEVFGATVRGAQTWLRNHIGLAEAGLPPAALAEAVLRRYGKDRTFSVPILTACALAGRLGSGPEAWRWVLPLPFELAVCPPQWFAALRLPVVSYALPALIAIGQVRHYHRPTRNPLIRALRHLARRRSLRVLQSIQPASGGFLEATPLTSFVVMSLAGSAQANHPVARQGAAFLLRSQRPDGSWPIDTNLATWVTTLACQALANAPAQAQPRCPKVTAWLLAQQYHRVHPYTQAAPGGWAWTDLPGGVPDADDTAGALLQLRNAACGVRNTRQAAGWAGIRWLLDLQNRDGGIPTFCRGWGALPFDRSSSDLTAHALRAWLGWLEELPAAQQLRVRQACERALAFLQRQQGRDGEWVPLWFGNQWVSDEANPTYGTARVVCALSQACRLFPTAEAPLARGIAWLVAAQNPDGGWGGGTRTTASVEETALALEAVAAVLEKAPLPPGVASGPLQAAVLSGTDWLLRRVESGQWLQPSPIGFYFAKLWYFEKLYPQIFTVAALGRVARVVKALQRED